MARPLRWLEFQFLALFLLISFVHVVCLVLGFGGCTQVPLRRACIESLTMHPYHLRWYRYRRLLAAVMTLPALDT